MSNETYVTIRGRLTADPEGRFTPSGAAVTNFTVAVSASKFDKNANEWKDRPTKFWRCQAWNQGKLTRGENIANLLKKGDNVIVYGELETREYEKDGEKRAVDEIRVESIGKDLTFHGQAYATGEPAASSRNTQNQGGWGGQNTGNGNNLPGGDPWASQPAGGGWAGGNDGVPF